MKARRVGLCAGLGSLAAAMALTMSSCCIPTQNQAPTSQSQAIGVASGGTVNITLSATDPDGPTPVTIFIVTPPSNGALGGAIPNVTYTPNAGFTGCDSFTYAADDGATTGNTATVTIAVDNQAPTATDVAATVAANQANSVTLDGADPDSCPCSLTYVIVDQPDHGTVGTPSGNTVTYTPDTDYVGPDSFTYRAFDGLVQSGNVGTATLDVLIAGQTDRKIILTLRNEMTDRYVHYHLHLIAFRKDVPIGDESRYEAFGYVRYPSGVNFGCYTFTQDLFYYYHRNGQFRADITDSGSALRSGIAPATSASQPKLDPSFSNRNVPLPSLILFHDPGTGPLPDAFDDDRGADTINPALDDATNCGCDVCAQASWYYVTELDVPVGIAPPCSAGRDPAAMGRYFRVPGETQDTVCDDCSSLVATLPLAGTEACHWLHNTALNEAVWPQPAGAVGDVRCYEYYLGSVVTYTFTDDGTTTGLDANVLPSLKWEVRTLTGQIIHASN